jgi:hypothetical protein
LVGKTSGMGTPLRRLDDRVGDFLTRRIFDRFGPVGETSVAPQIRPNGEGASIEVGRAVGGRLDRLRSYRILLDEIQIGELRPGETWSETVTPGTHTLRLKIDWTGSARATFNVNANEKARYRCAACDTAANPVATHSA